MRQRAATVLITQQLEFQPLLQVSQLQVQPQQPSLSYDELSS